MTITNKSKTDKNLKDLWRTPPDLINDALTLLNIPGFDTDVCCSDERTMIEKAETWISEREDALNTNLWFLSGPSYTSFCNPPISKKWIFFQKAVEQVNKWRKQVLMVMPYTPYTKEWHANVHSTNCIIYVPDGRYQFLLPDGSKPKNNCSFETCLILIVPFLCGNVVINYQRGLK